MNDPQESIGRWREANRRLRGALWATGAALAFLMLLAVIQFIVTLLAVRTLDDAKQESDRTRQKAIEKLRQLERTEEDARSRPPEEMKKEEKKEEEKVPEK
jgi:hypothetical protein